MSSYTANNNLPAPVHYASTIESCPENRFQYLTPNRNLLKSDNELPLVFDINFVQHFALLLSTYNLKY